MQRAVLLATLALALTSFADGQLGIGEHAQNDEDRPTTTTKAGRKSERAFEEMDADQDGRVTRKEFNVGTPVGRPAAGSRAPQRADFALPLRIRIPGAADLPAHGYVVRGN